MAKFVQENSELSKLSTKRKIPEENQGELIRIQPRQATKKLKFDEKKWEKDFDFSRKRNEILHELIEKNSKENQEALENLKKKYEASSTKYTPMMLESKKSNQNISERIKLEIQRMKRSLISFVDERIEKLFENYDSPKAENKESPKKIFANFGTQTENHDSEKPKSPKNTDKILEDHSKNSPASSQNLQELMKNAGKPIETSEKFKTDFKLAPLPINPNNPFLNTSLMGPIKQIFGNSPK